MQTHREIGKSFVLMVTGKLKFNNVYIAEKADANDQRHVVSIRKTWIFFHAKN